MSRTTGSASLPNITSESSTSLNGCTAAKTIPAPESGWPSSKKPSNGWAAASGWNPNRGKGVAFGLIYRSPILDNEITHFIPANAFQEKAAIGCHIGDRQTSER